VHARRYFVEAGPTDPRAVEALAFIRTLYAVEKELQDDRRNGLHLGGNGSLGTTAVLLSLAASTKRAGLNPWEYFRHILSELPGRPPDDDLTDLLPDVWGRTRAGPANPPT